MFDHINALAGTLVALAALLVAGAALRLSVRHDKDRRLQEQIDTQIKLARIDQLERENQRLHEAPEGEAPYER